ncbi:MAG TPA: trehalose-phosphatase [Ktedonobacteraceae bacterium]|nr:trehalose-phosphatase [Ktedonobacteraceae bacterium]
MQRIQNILMCQPLGLIFDIDGTLSPIAPTPDEAKLYPGVASLLEEARTYAHVAIVTGRAIEDAASMVNIEGITYIGTHGVEWCEGLPSTHPVQVNAEVLPCIKPGQQLLDLAEQTLAGWPGVIIERKRLGGSLHYRLAPNAEEVRQVILETLREPAHEQHFLLSQGKQVIDIKPALHIHKGQALKSLVQRYSLKGVIFAGDDRTDLDAMLEIEHLRQEGLQAAAIAVQAADTLPELLEHADIVVQGVAGMVRLLHDMLEQLRTSAGETRFFPMHG